jgi:hypothetical protein
MQHSTRIKTGKYELQWAGLLEAAVAVERESGL